MISKVKNRRILAILLMVGIVLSYSFNGTALNAYAAENNEGYVASETDADIDVASEEVTEVSEDETADEAVESDIDVNYVVIEEAEISTPSGDKYILVDMGDGYQSFSNAVLTIYNKTTLTEYKIDADRVYESSILFYSNFSDSSYSGDYELKSIEFEDAGVKYVREFKEADITPKFSVNKEFTDTPSGWIVDEDEGDASESVTSIADSSSEVKDFSSSFSSASAIGVDGANSNISLSGSSDVSASGKALASEIEANLESRSLGAALGSSSGNIIIVLDPGHGGVDSGAVKTWGNKTYVERDINQKIANACKAELEKNSGVTVYMTRTSTTEALHGTIGDDLLWRCKFANQKNADIFVSLHCNSGGNNTTVHGSEVYVPNVNYNKDNYTVGQVVGKTILARLTALGLTNRGVLIRNSENNTKYPDKTLSDYYAIIRGCKLYGIPAMIVEHAFVTNKSDATKYFGSDAKIAALGVADAKGIMDSIETIRKYRNSNEPAGDESGFVVKDGKTYYYDANGVLKKGLFNVAGKYYYSNASGIVQKGVWRKVKSYKYYFKKTTGEMAIGWLTYKGHKYYMDENGKRLTGWQKIDSKLYFFNKKGKMQKETWKTRNSKKVYLTSDGSAAKGLQTIDDHKYYFTKKYAMKTGWLTLGSNKYYFKANGQANTGWLKVGDIKYFFNKTGIMRTGWYKKGKKYYYLSDNGPMVTGWQKINGKEYYFNSKGIRQKGMIVSESKTYYLNEKGVKQYGYLYTDEKGNIRYFDTETGCMAKGLQNVGTERYFFNNNGKAKKSKWITISGNKYYAMKTGKFVHDNFLTYKKKTYYFGSDFKMVKGFYKVDGNTYYFDNKGVMARKNTVINGKLYEINSDGIVSGFSLYTIMGTSEVTVEKMVADYKASGVTYPAAALKKGGAKDIETFCKLIYDESIAEGVKPEVLYGQIMLETGYLQFGGDVKVSQYNFGGLGATGAVAGASFKNVQTGIRAQVQHLKAYASKAALKNKCVDGRFKYVTRGCAVYVEYLGQQENPTGAGWATGKNYGYLIMNIVYRLVE
ncbi:MAG: N-acetylmuramoyl-L-alanine amidase [Eubacterium sp.]|nr:N-acetylmuramoyl-L-alanine amidase [Eubacterium sp.]